MKEIFEAKSVAVVGASANKERPGYTLINSMLFHGYKGDIFPINPRYQEILGLKSYPSISDVPQSVDLVFLAIAANAILPILDDCAKKNAKGVVIISAGFSESSETGQRLESEIASKCKNLGMRILGPNTTGFVSVPNSLVASINHFDRWTSGSLAIGGQTGIFAGAYMDEVMSRRNQKLGYEFSVSLGNKADFDETDFVRYAGSFQHIRALQLYLESIKRPDEFFEAAASLQNHGKPLILLRGGRTQLGRLSTRAHTGSSGQDPRFDDNYLQNAGMIPATDIEEFFDIAKGFAYQFVPAGNRVGVVTMSGANGTLAADAADDFGLDFTEFSQSTKLELKRLIPPDMGLRNPADIGFAMTAGKEVRKTAMQTVLDDPNIDSLLMIDLPVSNSDYLEVRSTYEELNARGKPIFVVFQGGATKDKWTDALEGLKIPIYPTARRALRVLQAMWLFNKSCLRFK